MGAHVTTTPLASGGIAAPFMAVSHIDHVLHERQSTGVGAPHPTPPTDAAGYLIAAIIASTAFIVHDSVLRKVAIVTAPLSARRLFNASL